MRHDPERPLDLLTGDRRARGRARARRRAQIANLYWVLATVGLAAAALLLIAAPLHLMSDVATADQTFPPMPRVDALALVRELSGHSSQAGDTRSTVSPTATPLPLQYRSVDAQSAAAPDSRRALPGTEGQAPSIGARKIPATGGS